MSAVVFLLLALAIIVVGSVVVYLRQRTPSSLDAGIDSFRREMQALAARNGNGTATGNGTANGNGSGQAASAAPSEASGPPGPSQAKG
jgi:hypothetical protein